MADDTTTGDVTRRRMLELAIGAAVAAPIVDLVDGPVALARVAGQALGATAPRFFTPEQFALVDELAEMIIPADEHSPGARAARVAAYLDARLAESLDAEDQAKWRAGLEATDARSRKEIGKPFMQATPEERFALLTSIAKNEFAPKTPDETFFRTIKSATAVAYYTSEIGIHKEIGYLGNTYLKEYVGYDVSTEDGSR
jgi:hypothetical protein